MKKTYTLSALLGFLFCAFTLNAQQFHFPDGNFELHWVKLNSPYHEPYWEYQTPNPNAYFFYTLNSLVQLSNDQGIADLTAFRETTDVQSGQYCIRLTSGDVPVGDKNVFLPGMVGTLNQDFVNEFLHGGDNSITTYKDWYGYDTPHAMEGYFKYKPVEGDSALIEISFYAGGTEPVVTSKQIIKETVNDWTRFRVVIPQEHWDRDFSDIRILFVASAGVNFNDLQQCKGNKGSTLWIDNISLNYTYIIPSGIKENSVSTLNATLFPNPASDLLNIELNENFTGTVSVYNMSGSLILEEKMTGTQTQINISTLAAGNYVYKLMNENTVFAQGKFVVTK